MKEWQRPVSEAGLTATHLSALTQPVNGRPLFRRLAGWMLSGVAALALFSTGSPVRADSFIRAVRVGADSPTLRSADGCVGLVEHLRRIHATDLFVEVYAHGEGLYRSDLAPMPPDLEAAAHDPLGTILTEASRIPDRPVRVHAVVDILHVRDGESDVPPSDRNPARRHPGWLTRNRLGAARDDNRNAYLDPGIAAVRAHAQALVRDLLLRYPVDGLCLNGLRYPDADLTWGYAPAALEAFWSETGSAGHTPNPEEQNWLTWRRERLTMLLTDLTAAGRETRPGTVMSAVCLATGRPPGEEKSAPHFEGALQDWPEWARASRLDWLVLENHQDQQREPGVFSAWLKFAQKHQGDAKLVVVVAGWMNFDSDTVTQMRMALAGEADGILLDSYDRPALDVVSPRGLLDYLGKTVFSPGYVVPEFAFDASLVPTPAQPERVALATPLQSLPPPIPLSESFATTEMETAPLAEPPPSYSQADAARALLGIADKAVRTAVSPPEPPIPARVEDPLGRNSASETERTTPRPASYALDTSRVVRVTLASGKSLEGELLRHDDQAVVLRPVNTPGGVEITFRRADVESIQDINTNR